jgi:hypothetical protein
MSCKMSILIPAVRDVYVCVYASNPRPKTGTTVCIYLRFVHNCASSVRAINSHINCTPPSKPVVIPHETSQPPNQNEARRSRGGRTADQSAATADAPQRPPPRSRGHWLPGTGLTSFGASCSEAWTPRRNAALDSACWLRPARFPGHTLFPHKCRYGTYARGPAVHQQCAPANHFRDGR